AEGQDRHRHQDFDQADAGLSRVRGMSHGFAGAAQAPPPSTCTAAIRLPETICTSRALFGGRVVAMHRRSAPSSSPVPGPPPLFSFLARPSGRNITEATLLALMAGLTSTPIGPSSMVPRRKVSSSSLS